MPRSNTDPSGGEAEGRAPKLVDTDLERDPCPCRRLLEDHPERATGEEVVLLPSLLETLQLVGQVEDREQVFPSPVRNTRERAALQPVGDCQHPKAQAYFGVRRA